ncbi:MAG: SpoIIE family protein phosphatase, partial [Clostridiales bacterium]|nr:SpoIIE family protein phosphatase [Candidatus Apopatousia equi]
NMNKEIFRTKNSAYIVVLIKYLLFFAMLFILWKAGIKNNIYPFAIGLFIALCYCNQNPLILAPMFITTSFLASFSLENLFVSCVISGVIFLMYYFHKLIKKPIKFWQLILYSVISQGFMFYYSYSSGERIASTIISIILATIFMVCSIKIFKVILVRGIGLKLTIDETISLCVLLISISLGLSQISIFEISLSKLFAVFMILLTTYVYSGSTSIIVGTVMGLGEALSSGNIILSAGYALMAISAVMFRTSYPYYSCLGVIIAELIIGLYFNIYGAYTIFSFLSVLIGIVLFLLVSKSTISILRIMIGGESTNQASRNIVNRSRDGLCKKMFEMSSIFMEMNNVYRGMVKGTLPLEEAKRMLTQEVMQKVCADCPERHKCLRVLADETSEVFDNIVSAGMERGKATIIDVPPFLTTRCTRVNTILQAINQLIVSYKQYTNMINSMDTSRILIADQLAGISELLKVLATDTQKNITFDSEKENKILEELNYFNIVASEVMLYEKDTETMSATISVREKDKDNPNILKTLNSICGSKMILTSSTVSQIPSFYINEYKTAPKYDLVYGSSGAPKFGNQVSGDCYSFIKLTDDKVLLAICDGMGSGANAQKVSDTAISLIENFYKAGFENEIILNSVNRFLTMSSDDSYSALDLAIVDLKTSSVDFIKVGAPEGIIKHKIDSEILNAGALPLGILEEMKPTITTKLVDNSDMILMCSDGVIESFDGVENLKSFVNGIITTNPQSMSELIMDEVLLKSNNEPKDDCTVICARVFERI